MIIQDIIIFIFLKNKTEILNYLKQFYANIETDGHNVKRLRINCDKEFFNRAIKNYLLLKNIIHETMCDQKRIYRENQNNC